MPLAGLILRPRSGQKAAVTAKNEKNTRKTTSLKEK
jgi:hypothetical protein